GHHAVRHVFIRHLGEKQNRGVLNLPFGKSLEARFGGSSRVSQRARFGTEKKLVRQGSVAAGVARRLKCCAEEVDVQAYKLWLDLAVRQGGWVLSKAWCADQREVASAIGLAVRQGVAEVKLELRQVWKVVLRQAVRTRKVVLRQGLRGHELGYGLSFGKLGKPFCSLRKLESCGCAERQVVGITDWEHILLRAYLYCGWTLAVRQG
ncbi:Hypothetical predicted protein, partial [Prunus dulcis]